MLVIHLCLHTLPKMAVLRAMSDQILIFLALLGTVETICYYEHYAYYYNYYCYTSAGTVAGSVIGALIGLAILIGLIVFFCCIRPRRMAASGAVIRGGAPGVTVVQTGQTVTGGPYHNPTMYPSQAQPQAGYQQYGGGYGTQQPYGGGYAPPQPYGAMSSQQQQSAPPPPYKQ